MNDFLLERLEEFGDRLAIAEGTRTATYEQLRASFEQWQQRIDDAGLEAGEVVTIEGEYGCESIALLLALLRRKCILVPLSSDSASQHEKFCELSMAGTRIEVASGTITRTGIEADHELYQRLRDAGHAGLVLFTSGSTGDNKAVVHDLDILLEKFEARRHSFRTIVFLQLDHIGGVNTLLYTLSNGGAVVVPEDRSPRAVCHAIDRHRAELLPTSPTFLNLLLLDCFFFQQYLYHLFQFGFVFLDDSFCSFFGVFN